MTVRPTAGLIPLGSSGAAGPESSLRAKAALAAAKARKAAGHARSRRCRRAHALARKAQATQFAANVLPIIREVQAGASLNAIAAQLNARKVATR